MRLSKHVTPEVTDARLARQWAAISAKQGDAPRHVPWRLVWVATVCVVAAMAVFVWTRRDRGLVARTSPAAIEATAEGHAHASIADGCDVDLSPGARVEVQHADAHEVSVLLQRGAADFDVRHDPRRVFRVRAGSVEVVDLGTRFRVDRSAADDVIVSVQEGAVRVEREGRTAAELHAGETWTQSAAVGPATKGAAVSATVVEPPVQVVLDASVPVADPDAEALTRFLSLAAQHHEREAYDSVGPERFGKLIARANTKELMQLGDAARLGGHPSDAASAYDALRHRRSDARAGLAAFELGRLRLDKLADAAGAEEAFRDAITLSPDASFREDCEARRVEALEAMHDDTGCERARADYLARYPGGLYVSRVSKRCAR